MDATASGIKKRGAIYRTTSESEPPPMKYTTIGPPVGEGAYTAVYVLQETTTPVLRALKTVGKREHPGTKGMINFEMSILSYLSQSPHRSVPLFLGPAWGEDGTVVGIIMEYIPFPSLEAHLVANGAMEERDALTVLHHVLSVVQYLADRCIAHRDIKPANIMLNPENMNVKLIDYGLSAYVKLEPGQEMTHGTSCEHVGTPMYMAPEVLVPQASYLILPAETWSIGMVFWEMLVGRNIFSQFNCPTCKDLLKIQKTIQSLISDSCSHVSKRTRFLVQTMTIFDANLRPLPLHVMKTIPMLFGEKTKSSRGLSPRYLEAHGESIRRKSWPVAARHTSRNKPRCFRDNN